MRVDELHKDTVLIVAHPDVVASIKSQVIVDKTDTGDNEELRFVEGVTLRPNEFMPVHLMSCFNAAGNLVQIINLQEGKGDGYNELKPV